jgi:hypothetical protein
MPCNTAMVYLENKENRNMLEKLIEEKLGL